jgi:hypothetical protein
MFFAFVCSGSNHPLGQLGLPGSEKRKTKKEREIRMVL